MIHHPTRFEIQGDDDHEIVSMSFEHISPHDGAPMGETLVFIWQGDQKIELDSRFVINAFHETLDTMLKIAQQVAMNEMSMAARMGGGNYEMVIEAPTDIEHSSGGYL